MHCYQCSFSQKCQVLYMSLDKTKLIRSPKKLLILPYESLHRRMSFLVLLFKFSIKYRICILYPSRNFHLNPYVTFALILIGTKISTWTLGEENICYCAVGALNHKLSRPDRIYICHQCGVSLVLSDVSISFGVISSGNHHSAASHQPLIVG